MTNKLQEQYINFVRSISHTKMPTKTADVRALLLAHIEGAKALAAAYLDAL